ncbi:MAG: hypothetical protein OXU20_39930 [Myxococcales bacterium]|nr:hypothetical protein [Myxococcales bacterium]MDD9971409.1 hypothetical protein [Myxococcales bacterium]
MKHKLKKHNKHNRKLSVAIMGTGRIGSDLLMKTQRSDLLECRLVAGRSADSQGIKHALRQGVPTSDGSIRAIVDAADQLDLVFDATSATDHRKHAPLLERMGLIAVDLTPAKVGSWCVPSINLESMRYTKNINLITCGGQASIPVVEVMMRAVPEIESVQVHSLVSADSIGPATLANIDDYYASTTLGLKHLANARHASVELEVAKDDERPIMLTTIRARVPETTPDVLTRLRAPLDTRVHAVRRYVPGYRLAAEPTYKRGTLEIQVAVRGRGDFLPTHAGNLDIINCAALAAAEDHAFRHLYLPKPSAPVEPSVDYPGTWLQPLKGAWSLWSRLRSA